MLADYVTDIRPSQNSGVGTWAKKCAPGLLNFIPAVPCHFCFNLLEKFSQPGAHFLDPAMYELNWPAVTAAHSSLFGLAQLSRVNELSEQSGEGGRRQNQLFGMTDISDELQARSSPITPLVCYIAAAFHGLILIYS